VSISGGQRDGRPTESWRRRLATTARCSSPLAMRSACCRAALRPCACGAARRTRCGSPIRVAGGHLGLEYLRYTGPRTSGAIAQWCYFDRGEVVVRVVSLVTEPYMGRNETPIALAQDPPSETTAVRADGRPFSKLTRGYGDITRGGAVPGRSRGPHAVEGAPRERARERRCALAAGRRRAALVRRALRPALELAAADPRSQRRLRLERRTPGHARRVGSDAGRQGLAEARERRFARSSRIPIPSRSERVRLTDEQPGKEVFAATFSPRTTRQQVSQAFCSSPPSSSRRSGACEASCSASRRSWTSATWARGAQMPLLLATRGRCSSS
jgi:hypothetical protein